MFPLSPIRDTILLMSDIISVSVELKEGRTEENIANNRDKDCLEIIHKHSSFIDST